MSSTHLELLAEVNSTVVTNYNSRVYRLGRVRGDFGKAWKEMLENLQSKSLERGCKPTRKTFLWKASDEFLNKTRCPDPLRPLLKGNLNDWF